jgi:hypothetical protein
MLATAALRERFGVDLNELAGANVRGEIPFSDSLLNRLIAQRLENHPQISSVQLEALDGDAIAALLTPRSRLMPPIRVNARIERQPEFPASPVLILRWTIAGMGPLAMLAGPALAFFKALPQGIRVEADRLSIDLAVLLESRGWSDAVGLIRRAAIHTRRGGFLLQFELGL